MTNSLTLNNGQNMWNMNFNGNTGSYSVVLWCLAQLGYVASINFIDLYDYTFKALSLISITLIIAVNFKKGWKDYTAFRKQLHGFIVTLFKTKSKRKWQSKK